MGDRFFNNRKNHIDSVSVRYKNVKRVERALVASLIYRRRFDEVTTAEVGQVLFSFLNSRQTEKPARKRPESRMK